MSDHFGTAYLEDLQVVDREDISLPRRQITKAATKSFISHATAMDWDIFECEEDDQKYYHNVLHKIETIVDLAFPLKISKPKISKVTPWFLASQRVWLNKENYTQNIGENLLQKMRKITKSIGKFSRGFTEMPNPTIIPKNSTNMQMMSKRPGEF